MMRDVIAAAFKVGTQQDPIFSFFDADRGDFHGPVDKKLRLAVGEGNMNGIVFYVVKKIAGADVGLYPNSFVLKFRITWEFRRRNFAEISKTRPKYSLTGKLRIRTLDANDSSSAGCSMH